MFKKLYIISLQNNNLLLKYNRSMQLKKIKRTEKKGTESVMDEKFSILFSSKFFIGNELQFEVSIFHIFVVLKQILT